MQVTHQKKKEFWEEVPRHHLLLIFNLLLPLLISQTQLEGGGWVIQSLGVSCQDIEPGGEGQRMC